MVITRHHSPLRILFLGSVVLAGIFMFTTVAYAQNPTETSRGNGAAVTGRPTFQTGVKFIEDVGREGGYSTDTETTNLQSIVGSIIRAFLTLVGGIFLIMMVYGGYNWMIDRGDSERVKIAKDTITRAVIGLIIVMGAYAITNFITGRLVETAAGPVTVTVLE